jgi:hypothetical protein
MQKILNLINQTETLVGSGIVDVVNVYDFRYFNIYLDGELIDEIRKDEPWKTILKRSFIKECVTKSGVDEEQLKFVLFDLYDFGEDLEPHYDANDYDNYADILNLIKKHPGAKGKYRPYAEIFAIGITELEAKI